MTRPIGRIALFSLGLAIINGCDTETSFRGEKPDPVLVEYPVVYIERELAPVIGDETIQTPSFPLREPAQFNPGAQLLLKQNALSDSTAVSLTSSLFGEDQLIDIRDISIADDGQSFLVSIRAPMVDGLDEDQQPSWNIWRYQLATNSLEPVISDDSTAEKGDDLMPSYLPDGRILFASTRQQRSRAILLDEGKPQYTALDERRDQESFNLHVMEADGTAIKQISFNLSHDFYPLVQQNGKILYSRWDAMGGDHGVNLYQMNPDGTDNQIMFGWHSHRLELAQTLQQIDYIKPQQLPNGDIFMLLNSSDDSTIQKHPVTINVSDYTDHFQPSATANISGQAVADLALANFDFNFSDNLPLSGQINHLYPLPDNSDRYLISWNLCRVVVDDVIKSCGQLTDTQLAQSDLELAAPLYELWLLNDGNGTQQRVATTDEGKVITEAVVLQPSSQPKAFIADQKVGAELDSQLAEELAGSIHIRSVYDFDGQDSAVSATNPEGIARLSDPSLTPASALPARFLRIVRGVPMPPEEVRDIDNTDFGRSRNQLMREIIGYTPIQPDGSVKVKVPANVPLAISVLDASGQRIGGRHRQWLTVKPGESLECTGCHTANSPLPHGRPEAQATSINQGAIGGSPFPNTTPSIVAEAGQTMAEADAKTFGLAELSAGLHYQDRWTNEAKSAPNPSIDFTYDNLATPAPIGSQCFDNWSAFCRIQINYEQHIQPIWQRPRLQVDQQSQELLADNTCIICHSTEDTEGIAQVPAGQLDLTDTPSSDEPAHLTSYRELFFGDLEQETIDGILVDRLVELLDEDGNVVYEVDADGELILDENGEPIPVLTTVDVPAILSVNGARASEIFFDVIAEPSHLNLMSADELKLISEWLDIGAQYYNTPFYSE